MANLPRKRLHRRPAARPPVADRTDVVTAMGDPNLFGTEFAGATWRPWRVWLQAVFGLGIPTYLPSGAVNPDWELFHQCTGRGIPPTAQVDEAWMVVGRGGGKSRIAALVAVHLAALRNWRPYLSAGERATVLLLATDRDQAKLILRYVRGLLGLPLFAPLVRSDKANSISLSTGVDIEVRSTNYRGVRGYTLAAVICDEIAFWRSDEAANPDTEVLAALRPGLGRMPGSLLLCLSSPYTHTGELWATYARFYGRATPHVLVWQAATRTMNPAFAQHVVDAAYARDPARAATEYGAEFRAEDDTAYLTTELLAPVLRPTAAPVPYAPGTKYHAFVDPSGGRQDSFTLAIGHKAEDGTRVVDYLWERKAKFNPETAVAEVAGHLRAYGVHTVQGDSRDLGWIKPKLAAHGITYKPVQRSKSQLYLQCLPVVMAQQCSLPDAPRLVAQFTKLQRKATPNGDRIDHPRHHHDDLANAVAGLLVVMQQRNFHWCVMGGFDVDPPPKHPKQHQRELQRDLEEKYRRADEQFRRRVAANGGTDFPGDRYSNAADLDDW